MVSLVGLTYQVSKFSFASRAQQNSSLFAADADAASMAAFVTFMNESARTYASQGETESRYRVFKDNFDKAARHMKHEQHLPFQVTQVGQFADLTEEEFLTKVAGASVVPQAVMSPSETAFSSRKEKVPIFVQADEDLPATKNWLEEGMVSVQTSKVASECAAAWAYSAVTTLEALQAISGG